MGCECEICGAVLNSKSALNQHKKTSKACLKLQGNKSIYICSACDRDFANKKTLEAHTIKCITKKNVDEREIVLKLKNKIKTLETELKDLKTCSKELATKNDDKMLLPFNTETVSKKLPKDLSNLLQKGTTTMISVLSNIIGKGDDKNYILSDSRDKPSYRLDENNEWQEDVQDLYFDDVMLLFNPYVRKEYSDLVMKTNTVLDSCDPDKSAIASEISVTLGKMTEMMMGMRDGKNSGEKWDVLKSVIIRGLRQT
jgi:hypothetical protein